MTKMPQQLLKHDREILVTGVSGQLGLELVRQLGSAVLPRTRKLCDSLTLSQLCDMFGSLKPQAVIHAACFDGLNPQETKEQNRKQLWQSNVLTTDLIAKACAATGTPLLFVSCDQVFGGTGAIRTQPYKEAAPAAPASHYGMTKIAAEHAIFRLTQCLPKKYWQAGFKFWIVRVPYLVDRVWEGSINLFVRSLLLSRRKHISVPLPEDVVCSPVYVPHLAEELIWIAVDGSLPSGLYHLGSSGGGVSLYLMGCAIAMASIRKPAIRVSPEPARSCVTAYGQVFKHLSNYSVLDSAKYEQLSKRSVPTIGNTVAAIARDLDAYLEQQ
jgi:dTDP-4-dehydrorhamnose reductase